MAMKNPKTNIIFIREKTTFFIGQELWSFILHVERSSVPGV